MIDYIYSQLINKVITYGEAKDCRNGTTLSLFGCSLEYDVSKYGLPIISLRKIYTKGIVGEFKTFIENKTSHIKYFEANKCNYWKLWAKPSGYINIDYAPGKQLDDIIKQIKTNPHSRRHIINLWNHNNLKTLDLPCCHFCYQFYIRKNKYIDIIWTQRSVDVGIGLPSDLILATLYLEYIGQKTAYKPGRIIMNFGDTHCYKNHYHELQKLIKIEPNKEKINYTFNIDTFKLDIDNYNPNPPLKLKLNK